MSYRLISQAILFILAILIGVTYVQPQFVELQVQQAEVAKYADAVDKAQQFNNKLNELLNQVDSVSPVALRQLEEYIPLSIDSVAVSRDINTIAERSGLLVRQLQGSEEGADSGTVRQVQDVFDEELMEGGDESVVAVARAKSMLASRTFTVDVSGTYDQLISFLEATESNKYPLQVMKMEIASGEGVVEETSGASNYTITLKTYSLNLNN